MLFSINYTIVQCEVNILGHCLNRGNLLNSSLHQQYANAIITAILRGISQCLWPYSYAITFSVDDNQNNKIAIVKSCIRNLVKAKLGLDVQRTKINKSANEKTIINT